MKIVYFSFFLFLSIQKCESQEYCSGLIVSYNVTGSQCSGSGNFNIFHNFTVQTLFVSQSNTTLNNIDEGKLCAKLEFLDPGGTTDCVLYNTSVAGNFTIKILLCDSPKTIFSSIGPIFYNASGLSTNLGKCDNSSRPCSLTIPSFLKLLANFDQSFSSNQLSIDDYCTAPTPAPPPAAIAPPTPVINCSDPNISYYINQTCRIDNSSDTTVITQVINDTSTQIQEAIKAGSLNSSSVHDAGVFIYNTVKTVKVLNTEGAHSILDIINSIAVQPLHTLQGANTITNNSLLWYPSALPIIVTKTEQDLKYNKDGSNLLLHSFTLNPSFCNNSGNSHEICYSSTSQVPSGSKDAEFCTTFNPTLLCKNASKAYLTMWKSLSFFALVKNNSLGIKTGVMEKTIKTQQSNDGFLWSWFAAENSAPQSSTPNQPITFDSAEICSSGVYFKNSYASNAGGVDANGLPSTTSSTVWVKRRSDENDLHVSNFKIASFVADSFVDGGAEVTKNDKHYTAQCYQGTCTLLVDGNPTEPIVCSSGAKTTQAVIGGIGIFITVVGIFGFFFKSKAIPVISTIASVLYNIFNDKNLPKRLKFFAYCYNATFLLYSLYLLLFADQQITNTSKGMCTVFAVVGYILYISAVFLSVIMIIITLEALGCWKPMIQKGLSIFTGKEKIYVPFIYSYGIPLLLTAIFAAALTSFFKRNDGYCWIRPDYAFLALWFPLILLLFTIPLYIILIARRWPNSSFSKKIYSPLTISDDLTEYEASKKQRKAREKKDDKKDEDSIERGGQKLDDIDAEDEEGGNEDGKVVLTNRTIARLIIPQLFLAIPLIAENLALYYAKLTGWHYLFFLTQAFHLIALHGINCIDKIPNVRAVWNWVKGKFTKKSSTKTNGKGEVTVVEKPKKPPRGQRRNTLPNGIEDFEAGTSARDSELQNPRTEQMRMTRRQIEDSNEVDDGIEVIERNHQVSGPRSEEEESSSQPTRSYQNISSISIDSLTPKKQFKDDATIIKEIQRHAGAQDSGDTASKSSLRSYTPEVTSETEIPVKVHILRLDSNMLLDVPFIREPINEWLQDHKIPPYIPHEKPGGDWHHLDEQGVQLKFSDIPTVSGSSQSSSTLSHENELSESEVELVKEVVNNPKLLSQRYSDDTTQIIDNLADTEQLSKYDPNYRGMYELNQQPLHVLFPDAHLPLDIPFIREPVELSTWNNIPPSYIPYIGEMETTSDDSSMEEEMVEQVLHPNLPTQIFMDGATVIIESLPPVEELSNFEPNYSEMYHFDKNPVHTISPSYHLPLDIPFIRESIETAVAQGKTPSYIPLDPRRPSIISIHQDEMVGEVLEAIPTTGLPPDKWISPEPQQLPTYEINMDDLYKFDRHGLHDLSPTTNELPVDCPFIRNPVEIDLQRSRAPSYIPYEKDLALSDHREEDRLVKEVLDVKVLSLSELLHESSQDLMGMVTVVQEKKEKEWFDGVPSTFKRQSLDKGSTGYIVERHHEGNDVIHSMSPSYHLPLDYPFIPVVNETNAEHLPAGAPVGTGIQIGGYPTVLEHVHYHQDTVNLLVCEKELEKIELSKYVQEHQPPHYHQDEHELQEMEITKVEDHSLIGKGVEMSGYPEALRNLLGHHHLQHETTEILVYQKQMEELELSKYISNLSPQIYYTQHSIGGTSEISTSIYQTPPETPIPYPSPNLHNRMPSDDVSMTTQYYQTPPETPFQGYEMSHQHPLLSSHYHHPHRHHRHESSGSESEFPFFKFKTLRNENLVGPENVIHSDSASLAEE